MADRLIEAYRESLRMVQEDRNRVRAERDLLRELGDRLRDAVLTLQGHATSSGDWTREINDAVRAWRDCTEAESGLVERAPEPDVATTASAPLGEEWD